MNSSLFGLSRDVSDLHQALALLGIKPLKLLVLGFSLPGGLFAGVEAKVLGWYWRHTLTKAVAAREISQCFWKMPGDDAFVAGLLQETWACCCSCSNSARRTGAVPGPRAGPRAGSGGHGGPSHGLRTHGPLGPLAEPVELAGGPGRGRGLPPPAMPATALPHNRVPGRTGGAALSDRQPHVLTQLLEAGRAYHHLAESQLETLLNELEEKVQQLASVLSLELPAGLEYRDVLAAAHRQLAGVATQAAEELRAAISRAPCRRRKSACWPNCKDWPTPSRN